MNYIAKKSLVCLMAVMGFSISMADLVTNEWVYIKNVWADGGGSSKTYLRTESIDAGAMLSDLTDTKSQWRFMETTAGAGWYFVENRWAVENGESETKLWVDTTSSDAQLNSLTGDKAQWGTVVEGGGFFIKNKSYQASAEPRLWVNDDISPAQLSELTGTKAQWTVEAIPEPATLGLFVISSGLMFLARSFLH